MPTLPSGLRLGLSDHLIPEDVGTNFFSCPKNHFWHLDYDIPEGGYLPGDEGLYGYKKTPVPKTIEKLSPYVAVVIRRNEPPKEGWFYWRGEVLSDFPRYTQLTEEDSNVWLEWLAGNQNQEYLDKLLERCRVQAKNNEHAAGWFTVHTSLRPD